MELPDSTEHGYHSKDSERRKKKKKKRNSVNESTRGLLSSNTFSDTTAQCIKKKDPNKLFLKEGDNLLSETNSFNTIVNKEHRKMHILVENDNNKNRSYAFAYKPNDAENSNLLGEPEELSEGVAAANYSRNSNRKKKRHHISQGISNEAALEKVTYMSSIELRRSELSNTPQNEISVPLRNTASFSKNCDERHRKRNHKRKYDKDGHIFPVELSNSIECEINPRYSEKKKKKKRDSVNESTSGLPSSSSFNDMSAQYIKKKDLNESTDKNFFSKEDNNVHSETNRSNTIMNKKHKEIHILVRNEDRNKNRSNSFSYKPNDAENSNLLGEPEELSEGGAAANYSLNSKRKKRRNHISQESSNEMALEKDTNVSIIEQSSSELSNTSEKEIPVPLRNIASFSKNSDESHREKEIETMHSTSRPKENKKKKKKSQQQTIENVVCHVDFVNGLFQSSHSTPLEKLTFYNKFTSYLSTDVDSSNVGGAHNQQSCLVPRKRKYDKDEHRLFPIEPSNSIEYEIHSRNSEKKKKKKNTVNESTSVLSSSNTKSVDDQGSSFQDVSSHEATANTPMQLGKRSTVNMDTINQIVNMDKDVDYDTLLQEALLDSDYRREGKETLQNIHIVLDYEIPNLHLFDARPCCLPKKPERDKLIELGMKEGQFNKAEDTILMANWEKFSKEHGVTDPLVLLDMRRNRDQDTKLEFLQFLGQGLGNRALFQIYQRFFNLCHPRKGSYSQKEDELILRVMKMNLEQPFRIISRVLKRCRESVYKRYRMLTARITDETSERRVWNQAFAESVVRCLVQVTKASSVYDLKNMTISVDVWRQVEDALKVPSLKLRQFWSYQLHTQLFAESPVRFKEVFRKIIKWLYNGNPSSEKDIRWADSTHLVSGSTGWFMWEMFRRIRRNYHAEQYKSLQEFIHALYKNKQIFVDEKHHLTRFRVNDDLTLDALAEEVITL